MVKILKSIDSVAKKVNTTHIMEVLEVEKIALETAYYKRQAQKITATSFIEGFWMMQQSGKNSLRSWGLQTGLIVNLPVSKQGIDNRLNESSLAMVEQILRKALNKQLSKDSYYGKQINKSKSQFGEVLAHFNNIILHDSTIQQIPDELYEEFGGNKTKTGFKTLMRIQACYNFTRETWDNFSVDTYRKNDQSRATFNFDKLEAKDLLLRDLGYFTLDSLEQLIDNQYVITNLKPNVYIYSLKGEQIDLLKLLQFKKNIDMAVLVGKHKQLPMRLVARKLSKSQKKKRIEEAKKKAHSSCKYSKGYYDLLGYEIFLTNVETSILSPEQIAKLYGLRWFIEILFKSWKSYFNFRVIFEKRKMSFHRLMISIYLVLIQFIYLNAYLLQYIKRRIESKNKILSILKFMDVTKDLLYQILKIKSIDDLDSFAEQFIQHAVYEQRHDRKNMMQKYQYFKELNFLNPLA